MTEYWMETLRVRKTLSLDLVSHDTSICCKRIDTVPLTFWTHGMRQVSPGLAIFSNFPQDSTILTEPVEVTTQPARKRSVAVLGVSERCGYGENDQDGNAALYFNTGGRTARHLALRLLRP